MEVVPVKKGSQDMQEDKKRLVLARYKNNPTKRNAASLLECFKGLVEKWVRNYLSRLPANVDYDDLMQAGLFGLIQAAKRFDESRGVPFESFCVPRIIGSIQDELRNMNWLPRKNGNTGNGVRKLSLYFERDLYEKRSLGLNELRDEKSNIESLLEKIHRDDLMAIIRKNLSHQEWIILYESYIKGMTLKQVARRLSISPSHLCLLRHRIIDKLRKKMVDYSSI